MSIPVAEVISHWSHFFQSFTLSSNEFYAALEKIINKHQMPNTKVERTTHKEKGMFSSSREYLRIKHDNLVIDVCAAPFGTDFFISWWLYETEGTAANLLKGTSVGNFLKARTQNKTFFQIDQEEIFRSCAHECILEAITKVSEGKAERQLTKEEKLFERGSVLA